MTGRLDSEGVPTVTDSSASTRGRRTAGGRAFSGFAAGSTLLAYSPRKPTLPDLAPGGRCKLIGEVSTEYGRLFNHPVHLS
jgi:hypothetical protein